MCLSSSDGMTAERNRSQVNKIHRGFFYGTSLITLSMFASASIFPFLQAQRDNMNCDAFCYGSMQSARSGLSMFGTVLVGRMSDRLGRSTAIMIGTVASLVSYAIYWYGDSVFYMWLGMIPMSLLNQNYSVMKALFADYNDEIDGSESDRASAMGRLGMAVGIAFMLGPTIGSMILRDYNEAILFASIITVLSSFILLLLPKPTRMTTSSSTNDLQMLGQELEASSTNSYFLRRITLLYKWLKRKFYKYINIPAARTSGAKLLFFMRWSMAMAFSIYMTVWTVSLRKRFDFGPKDHAQYMGWIGLCYAISQGFIARYCIKFFGRDPTRLLLICICCLGLGRVIATLTTSLAVVYVTLAVLIVALGVMNTIMTSACATLADSDQVGGLFGIMESVENLAGLIGPTVGGLLSKLGDYVPLASVVLIYGGVFIAVWLFYEKSIVNSKKYRKQFDQFKPEEYVDSTESETTESSESSEHEDILDKKER